MYELNGKKHQITLFELWRNLFLIVHFQNYFYASIRSDFYSSFPWNRSNSSQIKFRTMSPQASLAPSSDILALSYHIESLWSHFRLAIQYFQLTFEKWQNVFSLCINGKNAEYWNQLKFYSQIVNLSFFPEGKSVLNFKTIFSRESVYCSKFVLCF